MAELLSPGVFVEEVPAQVQVIQAVSTSNLGIVGFTTRGPSDVATLVTSFEQFQKTFGGFVSESFMPMSVAAYFANGGKRAYVVRVAPADAVEADASIRSQTTDQVVETGDNVVVAFTKTAGTSLLKDNGGASPIVPSSLSMRWRITGSVTSAQDLRTRTDSGPVLQVTSQANYEARINPATLTAAYTAGVLNDQALHAIVPGTFVLSWNPDGGGVRTISVPAGTAPYRTNSSAANGQGSVVTVDHITGYVSVKFAGTDVPAAMSTGNIQGAFTTAGATQTISDNGAGVIPAGTALTGAGSISYADGSYSFTTTGPNKPHNLAPVLATYKINAWNINPVSKGAWANDMKIEISGDFDSFSAATATYSLFNVSVMLKNSSTGLFETVERYEGLDFATATSADFFADTLNELSDLVTVTEPAGNEAPGELNGLARLQVIAGGNELAGNQTITATLKSAPIAPRSVVIRYTKADGTAGVITDDGVGTLVGSVDGATACTINYSTGVLSLKTLTTIRGATLVDVTYRSVAGEVKHYEQFGDSTKSYTAGTNGTFTSGTYGRDQFTSPGALQTTYQGVYALSRVEEIMQVAVPDFAGNDVITADLLDYAEARASLPSGGDRFILLTTPKGSDSQEAVDWFRYTLARFSKFAAVYWPWVKVADPLANNRPVTMPPLGHVAGVYARTDATKNVGKSPGGVVDGALRFLTGLELETTQGERDLVYQNKINPLINGPQTGLAVWGVRTIASESEWRYINARRLFMFVERSVFNATHWIVFENNGPALWGRIKAQLNGFLTSLHGEGYFAGTTPAESFFVIVDDSNNSAATIEAGQVIIDVGIAPNKPAEFVRFRFQQLSLT